MKQSTLLSIILFFLLGLASCGPSKEEIIQEIRQIDHEMQMLVAASSRHYQNAQNAELQALLGSFATGYGATSGDYGLAMDGLGTASNASATYDYSRASVDQIYQRAQQLMNRRAELMSKLK